MPKRITYEDGTILDLDDDIDVDDLPEGEDDLTDDQFNRILADAEEREAEITPAAEDVDEEPDGAEGDAG